MNWTRRVVGIVAQRHRLPIGSHPPDVRLAHTHLMSEPDNAEILAIVLEHSETRLALDVVPEE
jgi:hypothetical protein